MTGSDLTSVPAGERPATDGRAGEPRSPKRCAMDGGFSAFQRRGNRVLDARDGTHRPTAGRAGLHVHAKDPFQALCPGAARRSAAVGSSDSSVVQCYR